MANVTFTQGRYVRIPDFNFFGQYSSSSNGHWYICWCDADLEFNTGRGGHREKGHGLYILYNKLQDKIILTGELERPQKGKVANSGVFSIEDWRFGEHLKSSIYIISPNGSVLISRTFEGNMFNSAISDNGKYLACQTANNPNSNDGNLLTIFDVTQGKELFSKKPVTGWANEYIFIEDIPKFGVVHQDVGTYYYDAKGNFLDEKRFDEEQLSCNKYEVVILKCENIVKSSNLNVDSAQKIIVAIQHALALLPKDEYHFVSWAALAFKVQGFAFEFLERNTEALDSYTKALDLNPKIGVKRKIDKINKILG